VLNGSPAYTSPRDIARAKRWAKRKRQNDQALPQGGAKKGNEYE